MSGSPTKPRTLPPGFESLERFAATWGVLDSPLERWKLARSSTPEELKELYATAAPMLAVIFEHLDRFPVDSELPEPELRLYRIAHGIIEAGQFVEVYGGKVYPTTLQSPDQIQDFRLEFTL